MELLFERGAFGLVVGMAAEEERLRAIRLLRFCLARCKHLCFNASFQAGDNRLEEEDGVDCCRMLCLCLGGGR